VSAGGAPVWAGGPIVRLAGPGDESALRTLAPSGQAETDAPPLATPPLLPPLPPLPSNLAEYLTDGCSFIAHTPTATIGYLLAQPLAYDGATPLTLWIAAVVVHPAWRRRGVGTALCRALGDWAREAGVAGALAAMPAQDVGTLAFWRRVGFSTHREELGLWRFDDAE